MGIRNRSTRKNVTAPSCEIQNHLYTQNTSSKICTLSDGWSTHIRTFGARGHPSLRVEI